MSLHAVLESLRLEALHDNFEAAGVGLDEIAHLDDTDLISLGVTRLGDRVRLRNAVSRLGPNSLPGGPTVGTVDLTPRSPPVAPVPNRPVVQQRNVAHGPRGLQVQCAGAEIVVWFRDTLALGRSTTEGSDVRLAVEPFLPAEQYPDNHARCFQISRVHMRLERRQDGIYATPLGAAGVSADGIMQVQGVPFLLVGNQELGVAQVLNLYTKMHGREGEQAVEIRRRDNREELSYVFGATRIGILFWEGSAELLVGDDAESGHIRLELVDGQARYTCTDTSDVNGTIVAADDPYVIREGMGSTGTTDGYDWQLSVTVIP